MLTGRGMEGGEKTRCQEVVWLQKVTSSHNDLAKIFPVLFWEKEIRRQWGATEACKQGRDRLQVWILAEQRLTKEGRCFVDWLWKLSLMARCMEAANARGKEIQKLICQPKALAPWHVGSVLDKRKPAHHTHQKAQIEPWRTHVKVGWTPWVSSCSMKCSGLGQATVYSSARLSPVELNLSSVPANMPARITDETSSGPSWIWSTHGAHS